MAFACAYLGHQCSGGFGEFGEKKIGNISDVIAVDPSLINIHNIIYGIYLWSMVKRHVEVCLFFGKNYNYVVSLRL